MQAHAKPASSLLDQPPPKRTEFVPTDYKLLKEGRYTLSTGFYTEGGANDGQKNIKVRETIKTLGEAALESMGELNAKDRRETVELQLSEKGIEKLKGAVEFPYLEVLWLNDNPIHSVRSRSILSHIS